MEYKFTIDVYFLCTQSSFQFDTCAWAFCNTASLQVAAESDPVTGARRPLGSFVWDLDSVEELRTHLADYKLSMAAKVAHNKRALTLFGKTEETFGIGSIGSTKALRMLLSSDDETEADVDSQTSMMIYKNCGLNIKTKV